MKRMVSCGQQGVFIPIQEFEDGLFLTEQEKSILQEKILENNRLIHSLQKDMGMKNGSENNV